MKKTVFEGSGVAIITPFTEDGVEYPKLGELIDFQIQQGTDCIVIAGTTGEASTMPDQEHIRTIQYTVERVAGRVPVLAGAGSNDTNHGAALCRDVLHSGGRLYGRAAGAERHQTGGRYRRRYSLAVDLHRYRGGLFLPAAAAAVPESG